MVTRQISGIIETNGSNSTDKRRHPIGLHQPHRVRHVGFEGNDEPKAVADAGSKVKRGAEQTDHWNAYGETAGFHSWIEGIALHYGIEAQALSLDSLLHQGGGFQYMMQARQSLSLFQEA